MFSVFLNPNYWYAVFPTPLLPRGQAWVLGFGLIYTLVLIIVYFAFRHFRPNLHSKIKHFFARIQFSALNLWMVFWFLAFCSWFGVTLFGNKLFLLLWSVYVLIKVIYFVWQWTKIKNEIHKTNAR
jgi:hypothetical protein